MTKGLVFLFVAFGLAGWSEAVTYRVPKNEPICSVNVQSNWTVDQEGASLGINSDDNEIYLNIEASEEGSLDAALGHGLAILQRNNVTIDRRTERRTEGEINGLPVTDFSWDGKDEDRTTRVNLTIVDASGSKGLLIVYWASPEGEKKHRQNLSKLVQSLRRS